MRSILIQPKSTSEYRLLIQVLEKMGIQADTISSEDKEDALLSAMMKSVDRNKKSNKEEVEKKLRS